MKFETAAIHAGQEADPRTGAVVPPIYQVSTFKQDGVGGLRAGYEYARSGNPTRDALEGPSQHLLAWRRKISCCAPSCAQVIT
jgi:cystathionine gamma-synthase